MIKALIEKWNSESVETRENTDITIKLNTDTGKITYITSLILGELQGIIINSTSEINIQINSFAYKYPILSQTINKPSYLIPTALCYPSTYRLDIGSIHTDKISLNEPLEITIQGQANTDVLIVLRLN